MVNKLGLTTAVILSKLSMISLYSVIIPLRFCYTPAPALFPMVPGTLWGTNYSAPGVCNRSSPLGHGTCQLVHGGEWCFWCGVRLL